MNLMKCQTNVIIASRDISRNEKDSANLLGVELETAPLATDALVFIVNPKNPVKNLSTEQLKGIYTGKITNWKEVGGEDHTITPYLRDADSGSQEKMETLVMKGLKMVEGPELVGSSMMSPYLQLEKDEYGIAYTPYYYRTVMMRDLIKVNVLSIDGVTPDKKSLREGRYPFTSSIYAAVRKSEPHDSMAYRLYEFLFTKKGGKMVDEKYPTNVLPFDKESDPWHPTQKPVDLLRYLVLTYTNEGDTVLDNCMGSGTTAIACIKEKRHFSGFELSKEYFDKAQRRIKAEQAQLTLW